MIGPYTLKLAQYTDRSGNFETLLSALVNGYIIEKSPEEKLREIYDRAIRWGNVADSSYDRGVYSGIKVALDILDVTIEGIND